jgi:hypothetical protein
MGYRYHAQDDGAAIPGFTSRNSEGIRPQIQSNEHIGNQGTLLTSWRTRRNAVDYMDKVLASRLDRIEMKRGE